MGDWEEFAALFERIAYRLMAWLKQARADRARLRGELERTKRRAEKAEGPLQDILDDHAIYCGALKHDLQYETERAETAERMLQDAAAVIRTLMRGDCWCEVAIGNPMYRGRHTEACDRARAFIARAERECGS